MLWDTKILQKKFALIACLLVGKNVNLNVYLELIFMLTDAQSGMKAS